MLTNVLNCSLFHHGDKETIMQNQLLIESSSMAVESHHVKKVNTNLYMYNKMLIKALT